MDQPHPSPISQFYSGRSVFVTGGTGFVGRAVVSKLLLACPNIEAVYVLIRAMKEEGPEERLGQILKDLPMLQERDVKKVSYQIKEYICKGFVGRAVVSKLLLACPDFEAV
jgi:FlaA1/EpsC-like NDP-sugar epimerase